MATIEVNGRRYRRMSDPLAGVGVNGCEYDYLSS
jgi:hypothetical protein